MRYLSLLLAVLVLSTPIAASAQSSVKRFANYEEDKEVRKVIDAARVEVRTTRGVDALYTKIKEPIGKLAETKDKKELAKLETEIDAITDDPTTLYTLAEFAKEAKEDKLAEALHERSLATREINLYERFKGSLYAKALTQEFMGQLEEAEKTWTKAIERDLLTAYFFLTRDSVHPRRLVLLDNARTRLVDQLKKVERGEPGDIYQTSKGTPRNLSFMDGKAAVEALRNGQSLKYVFIPELDLTGQTFEEPVGCQRCVVGNLKGFNSEYKNGFSYRGIVLNDLHLGKSWTGKVNRSRSIPAAKISKLLLDKVVVFGSLNLDSVEVGAANMPFVVVEKDADLKNGLFTSGLDFRFSVFRQGLSLKGAQIQGAAYLGHVHAGGLDLTRVRASGERMFVNSAILWGGVEVRRCDFAQGMSWENTVFVEPLNMHSCRIGEKVNFSRVRLLGGAKLQYVEFENADFFGVKSGGDFELTDSVIHGNARFALDGLNRRLHLKDPHPLHRLYKTYQGDVDSDEELTSHSQYGVVHVDDLAAQFEANSAFANTIFEKFVGFEGVVFGKPQGTHYARFYNTQMFGEAHFERTKFYALADFRTISGNELSFNDAMIARSWLLDDANIPGRLSVSGLQFGPSATLSFYGARMAHFGATFDHIRDGEKSRLFYEQCAVDGIAPTDDPRLLEAKWDLDSDTERTNSKEIEKLAHDICLNRTIGEYVVLRDSFNTRGMTSEGDWAYWHLRHYTNRQSRELSEGPMASALAWGEWLFFENAFGWGVRLSNLFWTSLVVILFYMMLIRLLCREMIVDWDDTTMKLKELPIYALFVISLHSFLGRARDWKTKSSNKVWKVLYTSEMIIGILLITFFIGAYARIILR